jgi:hypothetical protein
MADEPTATPPASGAPTARLVSADAQPAGNYRITEDGSTRDYEDGQIEQLDQ